MKAYREELRKPFIFLKQPTKEEIWRFKDLLNWRLSYTSFKYFGPLSLISFLLKKEILESRVLYCKSEYLQIFSQGKMGQKQWHKTVPQLVPQNY